MSEHDKNATARLIITRRNKRVKRESGKITMRDIVAGIMAIVFAFSAIGVTFLVMFTSIGNGFLWAAVFLGMASFEAMAEVGTDPARKALS